jgi:hypothetical protein
MKQEKRRRNDLKKPLKAPKKSSFYLRNYSFISREGLFGLD